MNKISQIYWSELQLIDRSLTLDRRWNRVRLFFCDESRANACIAEGGPGIGGGIYLEGRAGFVERLVVRQQLDDVDGELLEGTCGGGHGLS